MAEGTSYWMMRRRVRSNVAQQLANFEEGSVTSDGLQLCEGESSVANDELDTGTCDSSPTHSAVNESDSDNSTAEMNNISDEENIQRNF